MPVSASSQSRRRERPRHRREAAAPSHDVKMTMCLDNHTNGVVVKMKMAGRLLTDISRVLTGVLRDWNESMTLPTGDNSGSYHTRGSRRRGGSRSTRSRSHRSRSPVSEREDAAPLSSPSTSATPQALQGDGNNNEQRRPVPSGDLLEEEVTFHLPPDAASHGEETSSQRNIEVTRSLSVRTVHAPMNAGETGVTSTASELLQQLEGERSLRRCVVCLDSPKCMLLLPCRHVCACRACARRILASLRATRRRCPMCRRRISSAEPVYF